MSAIKSVHKQLEKVRKPRVHITYDVETEGASVKKELPFVVGVMGDFTGQSTLEQKELRDRKFVQVDADNFNDVMSRLQPGLDFKVKNTMQDDDSEIAIKLAFKSMDDFHPAKVAEQVEPLKKLIETRNRLRDLVSQADRSNHLESLLEKVLQNTDELKKLAGELNINEQTDKE